ncbi:MAG: RNA methyltransferase [Demequinaceae bacterium]|nr:RNA methyltransferase [Demequinaceae bacterium]
MTDPASSAPLEVTLSNPKADRVKRVRALAGASARTREGRFLVEGPQAVREAVRFAAGSVQDVYLTLDAVTRNPEILAEAWEAGLYVHGATAEVVTAMSPDAQGVLAVVDFARPTLDDVGGEDLRLVTILSSVRDPGNVGTIIRVADAAGADAVVLAGECADPYSPKVVRASTGSLFHLPVIAGVSLEDSVGVMRRHGLRVLATDGSGETQLGGPGADDSVSPVPTAWIFGNEARGLTASEKALADSVVRIPIFGHAESLNIGAAAAICLYWGRWQ